MLHVADNAIFATKAQEKSCDNRFCLPNWNIGQWGMPADSIWKRMEALSLKQKHLADALGMGADKVSKIASGARQWRGDELNRALIWIAEQEELRRVEADLPPSDHARDYMPVEVLPTYAGMGGGGNGDGDKEMALVPRFLIEDVFRGRPSDFRIVRARGDSMEPDFQHDDEVMLDLRDRSPTQPGPFGIWDGDGHVLKNVERLSEGLRLFPSNTKYNETIISGDRDDVYIMGRAIWFARRL